MHSKQEKAFEEFSATFPSDVVQKWRALLDRWYKNPRSKPDPFSEPETRMCHIYLHICLLTPLQDMTMNDIRLQLAREESRDIIWGTADSFHGISPSNFIILGLEIEEQQYVFFLHGVSSLIRHS